MTTLSIDTLAYSKKLIGLGFTQQQAEGFTDIARQQAENITEFAKQQNITNKEEIKALKAELEARDEKARQELATKQDLKVEAEKIRREIEQIKSNLLKWQIGIGLALGSAMLTGFGGLAYMMARGFHWAGF